MRTKRALAYPLAVGTQVRLQGRVKECVNLVEPGTRLLDIGCSSGWLAPLVISKGFRDYVGVDRVIIGADRAQTGTKFVEASVFSLPFVDSSFDSICMFDVIEHLPRGTERAALSELHRVLQTRGKLYFSTPHASPFHTPLDPVWLLGHRHYRRKTVGRLMASTGFTIERMFVAGGAIEGIEHIRHLVYKHAFHRSQPSIDVINELVERAHGSDHRFGMTLFVVAGCKSA
jgi:ubiquinone/menaquinone biosynthesis C-methylase UbiE